MEWVALHIAVPDTEVFYRGLFVTIFSNSKYERLCGFFSQTKMNKIIRVRSEMCLLGIGWLAALI